jgi:peptide/nickel transport system permease protein
VTSAPLAAPKPGPAPPLARLLARRRRRSAHSRSRIRLCVAGGLLATFVLLSLLQPLLGLPKPNAQNLAEALQAPSAAHPFGTDDLGRDVFSRTLAAAKLDLPVALSVTAISLTVGIAMGVLAGFSGRVLDGIVMRAADLVLAFPFLVLVLAISAIFGTGLTGFYIGVPLVSWAAYARLTRSEMLVVREQDYMLAARTLGYSRRRMVLRHAAPNVWKPAVVYSVADAVLNITLLATLSYLGVGVQPPTPEWGAIIADGQQFLLQAWWISTLPGLALVLVGICLALMADSAADVLGEEVTFSA